MKKIIIGLIIGFISGMFSAGGGLILVPIYTYVFKLDEKTARATTLFCILPMVLSTAVIYNKNNLMNWNLGIKCAIGGILGGTIGGKLLNKISNKILDAFFILFLFYAGFSKILK